MASTTYTPAITNVTVSPNPVSLGSSIKISVAVIDVANTPVEQVWYSGEIYSGEG